MKRVELKGADIKKLKENSINDVFFELIKKYKSALCGNDDIVYRSFYLCHNTKKAMFIYSTAMNDKKTVSQLVMEPLKYCQCDEGDIVDTIYNNCVFAGRVKKESDFEKSIDAIFEGHILLLLDGENVFIAIDIVDVAKRSMQVPETEKTLRGSREGFMEDVWSNIGLIRNKLGSKSLKAESMCIGKKTKTDVIIMYLDDIADKKIVEEIKKRLSKIDTDAILATGYIEGFIEDNTLSPFPQVRGTERPDIAVAGILEGRIAIMANGTPYALMAPALFIEFFQASEDYYEKIHVAIFIRTIRVIAFIISTTAPAIYIALINFHPELLPSDLLITLAKLRKDVPFPPVVEVITLAFILEVLREGGLRLPTSVGQTLGVVGGIVLSEALSRTNLISTPVLIIFTITYVCIFVIPNYSMSLVVRLIVFFLTFLAAAFGAYGISIGWLLIIIHLARQESIGVPYFAPLAPARYKDFKDLIYRAPIYKMTNRPQSIPSKDKKRMENPKRKSDIEDGSNKK